MAEPVNTTRWVTAEVLLVLAMRAYKARDQFAAGQLAAWTARTLTPEQRVHASSRLCALGFVKHRVVIVGADRVDMYTVTAEGEAAILAAQQGHVRKSGPKTTRGPKAVDPHAFSTRLWDLMRLRKMLTPLEAAETLCDAGDGDFEKRRATARKCLRRWCNAGALAEGARRVGAVGSSNGDKRYVLLKDSVQPPRWRKPATKANAATAGARA